MPKFSFLECTIHTNITSMSRGHENLISSSYVTSRCFFLIKMSKIIRLVPIFFCWEKGHIGRLLGEKIAKIVYFAKVTVLQSKNSYILKHLASNTQNKC